MLVVGLVLFVLGSIACAVAPTIETLIAARVLQAAGGAAGTVLEMDEGHQFAKGHPGMHTIPAALAFAEGTDRPGADLLAAIAIWRSCSAMLRACSRSTSAA